MNTYLKLSSVKKDKNCNCISPFYIDKITGINPYTGRNYGPEDKDALKTSLYRISNAKGCNVSVCCDPKDPTSMPDEEFTKQFKQKFPKIMPMYEGKKLKSIKLSTKSDVKESGWLDPSTHMICKITKATIVDTKDPNIKMATKLVEDCFTDQCNQAETITLNNLLQNAKADFTYTYVDDARVTQAIRDGNISYVKEYIRKYKKVNIPLTNDDYNNRMIHIASESKNEEIINMLIALKANLNITNKLKETPLHFAVRSKRIDNISKLLGQGVDMTIATNKGEIPMFYAMKTGDIRIINMLYMNNSPLLPVDSSGNNLIHYCILNCPSYNEDDETVPNTKSEIIRFLIDHGVSSEQKNAAGITPLELTSKEINREINKECKLGINQDENDVQEKFFNIKPIREAFNNNTNLKRKNGATKLSVTGDTPEHLSLLQIQTMLFNNIIRNNPNKYNKYLDVDEIPKGAPIEILDTVCVGDNITGNEDSYECKEKGGQLIKVTNKTTKIKLELIPEEETQINALEQKELYYPKENKKIPMGTIPPNIKNYNNSVLQFGMVPNTTQANQSATVNNIPQTTGITYNIGENASNLLSDIKTSIGFSPKPTQTHSVTPSATQNLETSITQENVELNIPTNNISIEQVPEHPPEYDEEDDFIHKCKKDAIDNTINITKPNTIETNTIETNTTTTQNNTKPNANTYDIFTNILPKVLIGFGAIILLLLIIYFIFFYNKTQ
jgi:ankyrin repeat protein